MSRPLPDAREVLRLLDQARQFLVLLGDVDAALARDPSASANQIYPRLRAAGPSRRRADVLAAVVAVRKVGGFPESGRGPGRPENASVPFSRRRERDLSEQDS